MRLIHAYKNILRSTEVLVKQNSPHLNLTEFILKDNASNEQIIENLNKLAPLISQPHFSHIFLKYQFYKNK